MLTLEAVAEAFEQWRKERIRINEPVPARLWEMVQSLSSDYKIRQIQKALSLNTPQVNKYLKPSDKRTNIESTLNNFAVGTLFPKPHINDDHCELTLQGVNKSLRIKINIQNIAPVLSLMEQYL
jgi:hypothetical protein